MCNNKETLEFLKNIQLALDKKMEGNGWVPPNYTLRLNIRVDCYDRSMSENFWPSDIKARVLETASSRQSDGFV